MTVAVAVWLAGNLRSIDRAEDATEAFVGALARGAPPTEVDRARQLFDAARRLGPDGELKVNEAGFLAVARPEAAVPLLREVVRDEPDNLEAWVLLYPLLDGPAGVRARRRVLALDPSSRQALDAIDANR